MISKIKKPVSILLVFMMIVSLFTILPISANAEAVTPKYKITINGKVVVSSTALPYTTSATNLKNKAGYSSYTVTYLKVYKAKDNIGTISGQNFTVNKSGSEQLDIGLKKGSSSGHITPNVVCTPLTPCVCEATGYTGNYDGEPHTIEGLTVTSPESGATVKYGTVSGTYNLTEPPTFTEVGTHTVYYQISASGWVTKTGSVNVVINPKPITITWKNYDDSVIGTSTVEEGVTPTFSDEIGEIKAKPEDANNTYTFSGWSDGSNTYAADALPAVSGDVTYTATFTAVPKSLIPRKSLTLDGNIIVNFFIDPSAAGLTPEMVKAEPKTLTVTIDWADYRPLSKIAKTVTITVDGTNFEEIGDLIPVSCEVCAAEMSCDIKVDVELNGESDGITYSVRDYGKTILDRNSKYAADEYASLRKLVVAMLDYGAKAQEVFGIKTTDPANGFFGDEGYKINLADYGITYDKDKDEFDEMFVEAIEKANGGETGDDISAVAANHGAKWYTTSVYFLNNNKIRHVFTKANDTFNPELFPKENNQHNFYYWVESKGIPAAELDTLQTFKVGDTEFYYSVLDYARKLASSTENSEEAKYIATNNLAKAIYWYNQAANAYFDEPAPVENVVDLSTLTGAYEAQDGDVLINALSGNKKITVADGAKITLRNANITSLTNAAYAGITPLGDATILLEGTNVVKGGVSGGYADYPGIFAPVGYTLTIDGTGSLTASKGDDNGLGGGGGIGGVYQINAGNIVIKGGNVTAIGGYCAAGIGGGCEGSCGAITITGGTVNATGGVAAAGIGSGYEGSCGDITIADTVTSVTATKGEDAPNSIGAGLNGTCGTISIADPSKVTQN